MAGGSEHEHRLRDILKPFEFMFLMVQAGEGCPFLRRIYFRWQTTKKF